MSRNKLRAKLTRERSQVRRILAKQLRLVESNETETRSHLIKTEEAERQLAVMKLHQSIMYSVLESPFLERQQLERDAEPAVRLGILQMEQHTRQQITVQRSRELRHMEGPGMVFWLSCRAVGTDSNRR